MTIDELLADIDLGGTGWMDRAACAEIGGDFWFPERGQDFRFAKALCHGRCPVQSDCLEYALAHSSGTYDVGRFGLWGGYSDEARQKMLRDRRKGRAA